MLRLRENKMARKYTKREPKEFNWFRAIFQRITVRWVYGSYFRVRSKFKIIGTENIPKDKFFIVASNHVSAIDPFLVCDAINCPIAYMAKKELFEKPIMRIFMDLLGAFAVNREKLDVSTIKTVMGLKNTKWKLGLFPEGTRTTKLSIENVSKGFAFLAKSLKCDILPVGISGAMEEERRGNFRNKMTINIGKPIPYNDNLTELMETWVNSVNGLIDSCD